MRKSLILAIVYAMVLVIASGAANAYRSYTTSTGKACGYCHVDPGGGGTLTAAGEYYLNNGTLPPEGPAAPTGLGASAISSTQINLSWTDASTNETGFTVQRSSSATGTFSTIGTVGANVATYSNTGLTASTTYYYRVFASNSAGNSANSNTASATTLAPPVVIPSAPTGLGASAISSTQINLSWTDASANETGFKVERSASASGPFTLLTTVGAGVTTYSNTGLTASTTYYYRVCATNTAGDSGYATASAATQAPPVVIPAAPTGLGASAVSSTQINLSWTDASANETGFTLQRSGSAGGTFTTIGTVGANVTTYSNTGLTASTPYFYRVFATNSAGNSGYSNTASATTSAPPVVIPAAPTGLGASAVSSTQINLSWTDASANETGFKVERSASASGPFTLLITVGAGVTTYSNTGLTASTTYYYRVCATNTAGDSGYATASAATQTPPVVIPAAPTDLAASPVSVSEIDLSWTDASSNETGFKVERASSADGTYSEIATPTAGETTYSDVGLPASTTFYYRVRAYTTSANSDYSNTVSAATLAPEAPAAPTDLAASPVSVSQINLSWTDASSNETGFKVERSSSASGTFTPLATVGAGVTTYNNTGLSASTTYYYRVCATNDIGDSAYATASASTPAPPPAKPAAPTGLGAVAASVSQINLSWTDNSTDETSFKVERASSASGTYALIATLGSGVTTYSNMGLTASTTYYYRVCASNAVGDSAYATASATTLAPPVVIPTSPNGLAASAVSSSQINLSWMDASSNETGFKVERSSSASGPFTLIATVGAGVRTYTSTGLTASTTYFYRVCATNSAGDSGYATASAATPAVQTNVQRPAAPTDLTAKAESSSRINVRWRDRSTNETGFILQRSSRSGKFATIATLAAGVTSYSDTGLAATTKYYYRVCSYNSAGSSSYTGKQSATTLKKVVVPVEDDEDDDDDGSKSGGEDRRRRH